MRVQGVADDALVSAHRTLRPSPGIIARGSLPAHPALLGNDLDMAIALGRVSFGRGAEHGRRPWRHDNRGFRGVLGHSIVNPVLVIRSVMLMPLFV